MTNGITIYTIHSGLVAIGQIYNVQYLRLDWTAPSLYSAESREEEGGEEEGEDGQGSTSICVILRVGCFSWKRGETVSVHSIRVSNGEGEVGTRRRERGKRGERGRGEESARQGENCEIGTGRVALTCFDGDVEGLGTGAVLVGDLAGHAGLHDLLAGHQTEGAHQVVALHLHRLEEGEPGGAGGGR